VGVQQGGEDPALVVTSVDQTVTDSKAFTDAMCESIRRAPDLIILIISSMRRAPGTGFGNLQARSSSMRQCTVKFY